MVGLLAVMVFCGRKTVKPISTQSTWLCAVELVLNNISFLLCNVYMPTTGCCNINSEYKSVLNEIRSLLEEYNCFYALILVGILILISIKLEVMSQV